MAYNGRSFMDISQQFQGNAISARSAMRPSREEAPGKTVGGAMMSGAGMAGAGYTIGATATKGASGGPWGAVIGAGVGILSYLLS